MQTTMSSEYGLHRSECLLQKSIEHTPHWHSCSLHFLPGESLPHFTVVWVDCVVFLDCGLDNKVRSHLKKKTQKTNKQKNTFFFPLTDDPVNWIMVIKSHKSKSPLLPTVAICHDINNLNFAKLLEVISQVWLFCVFFDSANKDFFHRYMSTWPVWILQASNVQ